MAGPQPHVGDRQTAEVHMQGRDCPPIVRGRTGGIDPHVRAPRSFDQPMTGRRGFAGKPHPKTEVPQSRRIHPPRRANVLARDPRGHRLVRELGGLGHELKPCRCHLRRARKVVGDLSAKQLTVRQARDRTHECLGRQLAQPQGQIGEHRGLREGDAIDHARDRACGIEPCSRNGEREQQRRKARGKVSQARVPHGQRAHRALDARMIAPKPPFEQLGAPGHLVGGRQDIDCHDTGSQSRANRPR